MTGWRASRMATRVTLPITMLMTLVLALVVGCSAAHGDGGVTLRVTQFPWSAAKLTNAILAEIAADHPELGVSRFTIIPVGTSTAWAGAQTS